jgi:CRISPR-associated exonuclease Cas4
MMTDMVRPPASHTRIGGMLVGYYAICPRKAWLVLQGISMEQESEQVALGRVLDDTSYRREQKGIDLAFLRDDGIELVGRVDWADLRRGVLHETKKSRSMDDAHRLQLCYYLWLLELCGVEAEPGQPYTGVLDYPLLRRSEEVVLDSSTRSVLEGIVLELRALRSAPIPDLAASPKLCRKCAFNDLCHA